MIIQPTRTISVASMHMAWRSPFGTGRAKLPLGPIKLLLLFVIAVFYIRRCATHSSALMDSDGRWSNMGHTWQSAVTFCTRHCAVKGQVAADKH